ncbi:hypothetical protein [Verrucosispora sp. TAA-831]|uniref:hypothetical protein n=1 Tax=Verrucosispora sp. TAA-831 TaxID=3422227 RepID=UPI003D6F635D
MSRAALILSVLRYEALAKACKARLARLAESEYRQEGIKPTWKADGATVSSSTSNPHVAVTDPAAFLAYVETRFPTEVETVRQPRPAWSQRFLEQVAERGHPACDAQGEEIPGLEWRAGGEWKGISIRATPEMKALLAEEAADEAAAVGDTQPQAVAPVGVPQP